MKLLLHMCCAPCSIFIVDDLIEQGIEFEGLFYNPNIQPIDEFKRRRDNVKILSEQKDFNVSYDDAFMQDEWENFGGSEQDRCTMCYRIRMDEVAAFAKEKGFTAFTTSLLISPYQQHDLIIELCEKAAAKHGIEFYYKDYRPNFRPGQQMAREAGLYRQKYCGCILSYNNRGK